MPLPPALAARLARRGLIPGSQGPQPGHGGHGGHGGQGDEPPPSEEIIAEDYDSRDHSASDGHDQLIGIGIGVGVGNASGVGSVIGTGTGVTQLPTPPKEHPGCPNKYNVYHECNAFCVRRWRLGHPTPPDIYSQLKRRLLDKFPLPAGWEEVYDPGCGQHYYWNLYNNLVSWLPPTHPRAHFSESAARLRDQRIAQTHAHPQAVLQHKHRHDDSEHSSEDLSDQEVPQRKRAHSRPQHDRYRDKRDRYRDRDRSDRRHDKRVKLKDNDLDPMDPAAYSDIPRGEWSTGLEGRGDAKTGVDTTASGPLFQMRPYPSPGAILMANAKSKPPPATKKGVSFPDVPK